MSDNGQDNRSHLFLVRVRAEEISECLQPESKLWSGRVQQVVTGETYNFLGWAELIRRLGTMLDDPLPGSETSYQTRD
jgi:hypothetical protein